jgi:hypothetical protein
MKPYNKKAISLLILMIPLQPLALLSMETQNQNTTLEPRLITDHYLSTDIWIEVAEFLDGKDLFLNTDLARHLILSPSVRDKIFRSFVKRLKKMSPERKTEMLNSFYNSMLDLDFNHLRHSAHIFAQLESAFEKFDSNKFQAILANTNILSQKTLKKIMAYFHSKSLLIDFKPKMRNLYDTSLLANKEDWVYRLIGSRSFKLSRIGFVPVFILSLMAGIAITWLTHHDLDESGKNGLAIDMFIDFKTLIIVVALSLPYVLFNEQVEKIITNRKQTAIDEFKKLIKSLEDYDKV